MEAYLIAFITGLTTGGLSCLAVQGGLLASSLSRQVETDLLAGGLGREGAGSVPRPNQGRLALSILIFLTSKLVVYTFLGFLLGALGSLLQLNVLTRAGLLIAIGIFMLGNALRMLDVHPLFRYFAVEPPRFITRFLRRSARNGTHLATPLMLGALTVLIPCGVTQAMMAAAVGTGSPLAGAVLMFAFTLGTSPVFFAVAYLAMQLGRRLEKWFMRFAAVVVLVLGLVSIESGLNLAGSPLSVARWFQPDQPSADPAPLTEAQVATDGTLVLSARNNGYSPRHLAAPAGRDLILNLVTQDTFSCARSFVIPILGVEVLLPQSGSTPIGIPAQPDGTVMQFTCSMGMYTGEIVFGQ